VNKRKWWLAIAEAAEAEAHAKHDCTAAAVCTVQYAIARASRLISLMKSISVSLQIHAGIGSHLIKGEKNRGKIFNRMQHHFKIGLPY